MAPGVDGQFVGMFSEDAKFRRPSWLERLRDKHVTGPFRTAEPQAMPSGLIRSYVRRVQDYRPPSHATASLLPHSLAGSLVSDFATVAYGHRRILIAPQRVTTDSRQRVIVTDSAVPAVHVLDPRGENSFSILAGSGRRIAWPSGVAVDADDNIYVADPDKGSVFVYDTYGRFVRTLGDFHGETLFEAPTGIAIDRANGHLYVADGPRNVVYMLDLQGNELQRVGEVWQRSETPGLKTRHLVGSGELRYPSDIAIGDRTLVVLDSDGTRVRIIDFDCNLIGGFSVVHTAADRAGGVAVDNHGYIYVSYLNSAEIKIYKPDGQRLGSFGQKGYRMGQFNTPRGMFIDAAQQLHVADSDNARVQLFQLNPSAPAADAN